MATRNVGLMSVCPGVLRAQECLRAKRVCRNLISSCIALPRVLPDVCRCPAAVLYGASWRQ